MYRQFCWLADYSATRGVQPLWYARNCQQRAKLPRTRCAARVAEVTTCPRGPMPPSSSRAAEAAPPPAPAHPLRTRSSPVPHTVAGALHHRPEQPWPSHWLRCSQVHGRAERSRSGGERRSEDERQLQHHGERTSAAALRLQLSAAAWLWSKSGPTLNFVTQRVKLGLLVS